jgi:hypothetical protein
MSFRGYRVALTNVNFVTVSLGKLDQAYRESIGLPQRLSHPERLSRTAAGTLRQRPVLSEQQIEDPQHGFPVLCLRVP